MSDTVFYKLVKQVIPAAKEGEFRICTAAIWSCQLCGEMIDGMDGPGSGEICVKCGDDMLAGRMRFDRAAAAALKETGE